MEENVTKAISIGRPTQLQSTVTGLPQTMADIAQSNPQVSMVRLRPVWMTNLPPSVL